MPWTFTSSVNVPISSCSYKDQKTKAEAPLQDGKIALIVTYPVLEGSPSHEKEERLTDTQIHRGMFPSFFLCQGSSSEPWSTTEARVLSPAQQANRKAAPARLVCSIAKLRHFGTTTLSP